MAATAAAAFLFGGDAVYDPASGLYLHGDGVRPTRGFLFIQRDSRLGSPDDPIALHKYLYADANTITGYDPSGFLGLDDLAGDAAAIGAEASAIGTTGGALSEAAQVALALTTQDALTGAVGDALASGETSAVASSITQIASMFGDLWKGIDFTGQITKLGVTVLGSYPGYAATAQFVGASFFSLPKNVWDALVESGEDWAVNEAFLNICVKMNQTFAITSPYDADPNSALYKEVTYLLAKGYSWANGNTTLVPPT